MTLPGRLVLLGHPVAHSLSPRFQNAALRAAAIPLEYEALDVAAESVPGLLATLKGQFAAGNVTLPHKGAVAAACARLTATASRTGAVNTFWHEEDPRTGPVLVGDNTDVAGFQWLARSVLGAVPSGTRVALLGAGGGAAAVCAAVETWPEAGIVVFARNGQRAALLAARFPGLVTVAPAIEEALAGAHLVVNATPVGLAGAEMPVAVGLLPGDAAVMDLAYRPGETPWVRAARLAGHRAADGLEMLLAQGAEAFERWFGRAPDRAAMRAALVAGT